MDDLTQPKIPKRILVIDSEANIRQIVQACLKTVGGWEVSLAASTQEGLSQAQRESPDAILLEGTTIESKIESFFEQLQSLPKIQPIPVVFLTEKPSLTERHRFLQLGVAGAIAKPFNPMTLAQQIAGILNWTV